MQSICATFVGLLDATWLCEAPAGLKPSARMTKPACAGCWGQAAQAAFVPIAKGFSPLAGMYAICNLQS